jgi:hypothetical protein
VRTNELSKERVQEITLKLLDYCKRNNWAGYDPYDALNSKLFKYLPFLDVRLFRLVMTQGLKRMPVNIRPLLLIPKTENPKAIALFLMSLLKLDKLGVLEEKSLISIMIQKLIDLRSPHYSTNSKNSIGPKNSGQPYCCWGYSFPWQTRTMLVPRGAPNLVCTAFVANALLDAYEAGGPAQCLSMALSASECLLNELYWKDDDGTSCFAYPTALSRARVHNANFLGAALLCRAYRLSGDKRFLGPALEAARYSCARQKKYGSWTYGEDASQQWVDNFHTGYNLCALKAISEYAETAEFETQLRLGFEFYRSRFFEEGGVAKYFHDRTYPIDIHCVAQSIITLLTLGDLGSNNVELALSVARWSVVHMYDRGGFFYYQALPFYTKKISYIRWSQAWMLLAHSTLLSSLPTN